MTENDAQTRADDNNAFLTSSTPSITDKEYKILETFPNYISDWRLCMVPVSHNAKYNSATSQQMNAFARVYNVATKIVPEVNAGYVAQYNIDAANDSILGPYLGL